MTGVVHLFFSAVADAAICLTQLGFDTKDYGKMLLNIRKISANVVMVDKEIKMADMVKTFPHLPNKQLFLYQPCFITVR